MTITVEETKFYLKTIFGSTEFDLKYPLSIVANGTRNFRQRNFHRRNFRRRNFRRTEFFGERIFCRTEFSLNGIFAANSPKLSLYVRCEVDDNLQGVDIGLVRNTNIT